MKTIVSDTSQGAITEQLVKNMIADGWLFEVELIPLFREKMGKKPDNVLQFLLSID